MNTRNLYSLWLLLAAYWSLTFMLLGTSFLRTAGHFVYPLDDAYIHMAIGRNFAAGSFWGISQGNFASSTSSPLWTLLIASSDGLFGVSDQAPLALSALSGSLTLVPCWSLLRRKFSPLPLSVVLLLIMLVTLLPVMTLTGMEHGLHTLLTLCLLYIAAAVLSTEETAPGKLALFLLLCALLPAVRYEGFFLIVSISLLFFLSGRHRLGSLTGAAGLLPVTVYGTYSMYRGWYFLPNSVLLKGRIPSSIEDIPGLLGRLPGNLFHAPHIPVIVIACLCVYVLCRRRNLVGKREGYLTALYVITALLHLQFAAVGWFYRYESYLAAAGCVMIADMAGTLIRSGLIRVRPVPAGRYAAVIFLAVLFTVPLVLRAANAYRDYPIAAANIYEQQYQMGLFLKTFYDGRTVAANDIGAISYLSDARLLDLYGLGSIEVARARRSGVFTKETISAIAQSHDAVLAVIYSSWFEGKIPSEWEEVGRWQIADNVVCGDDEVSFYATSASRRDEAIGRLKSFSGRLPSTVRQSGPYTGVE